MRSVKDSEVSCLSLMPACHYDNPVPLMWDPTRDSTRDSKEEKESPMLELGSWLKSHRGLQVPTKCLVVSGGHSERP